MSRELPPQVTPPRRPVVRLVGATRKKATREEYLRKRQLFESTRRGSK